MRTSPLHLGDDGTPWHEAMEAAGVSPKAKERFRECAEDAYIARHDKTGELKLFGHYCGSRFCRLCVAKRAARVRAALLPWLKGRTYRFMTLTLKHRNDEPLRVMVDRLYERFHHLRRLSLWKKHVVGGASFLEVKRTSKGWHPHLHILIEGSYFPQSWLSELWLGVTRDSKVVDIRKASDERTAKYVAKYACKGFSEENPLTHDQRVELVHALHGRRLVIAFGTWNKKFSVTKLLEESLDEEVPLDDETKWTRVCSLGTLIGQAKGGDETSIRMLVALDLGRLIGLKEAPT